MPKRFRRHPVKVPDLNEGEVLKDHPDWEGLYAVTNHGRVWSHPRPYTHGRGTGSPGGWIVGTVVPHNGIRRVLLTPIQGPSHPSGYKANRHQRMVSDLVLETFVGFAPVDKPEALHCDLNPANDHLDNLAWGTVTTRMRVRHAAGMMRGKGWKHSEETLARMKGVRNGKMFTPGQVKDIRKAVAQGNSRASQARLYRVSGGTIAAIVDRTSYMDVI